MFRGATGNIADGDALKGRVQGDGLIPMLDTIKTRHARA
jgi:hypothetical protein